MRIRLLTPVLVVVVVVASALTGCSEEDAVPDEDAASPSPVAKKRPTGPCELTATVEGVTYHARGIYGEYDVDPARVEGDLTPCAGVEGEPTTFALVSGVKQEWALVAEYQGKPVFLVTDDLPPIPSDSEFARILVGDFAD